MAAGRARREAGFDRFRFGARFEATVFGRAVRVLDDFGEENIFGRFGPTESSIG